MSIVSCRRTKPRRHHADISGYFEQDGGGTIQMSIGSYSFKKFRQYSGQLIRLPPGRSEIDPLPELLFLVEDSIGLDDQICVAFFCPPQKSFPYGW